MFSLRVVNNDIIAQSSDSLLPSFGGLINIIVLVQVVTGVHTIVSSIL